MAPGNKYHAHKLTTPEGIFDSGKEYNRWRQLKLLERGGAISNLCRQVKFTLVPEQREPDQIGPRGGRKPGRLLERPVCYVADFTYRQGDRLVVEDCKGVRTPEYIMKRKLMLYVHGIQILET